MIVNYLTAFLELVEFLKYWDWYDYIVFIKVIDAGTVMEDNVGVENKDFLSFLHDVSLRSGCLLNYRDRVKREKSCQW